MSLKPSSFCSLFKPTKYVHLSSFIKSNISQGLSTKTCFPLNKCIYFLVYLNKYLSYTNPSKCLILMSRPVFIPEFLESRLYFFYPHQSCLLNPSSIASHSSTISAVEHVLPSLLYADHDYEKKNLAV